MNGYFFPILGGGEDYFLDFCSLFSSPAWLRDGKKEVFGAEKAEVIEPASS